MQTDCGIIEEALAAENWRSAAETLSCNRLDNKLLAGQYPHDIPEFAIAGPRLFSKGINELRENLAAGRPMPDSWL